MCEHDIFTKANREPFELVGIFTNSFPCMVLFIIINIILTKCFAFCVFVARY